MSVPTRAPERPAVARLVGLVLLYAAWPVIVVLILAPWLTAWADARTIIVVKAALVAVGLVVVTVRSDPRRPLGLRLGAAAAGYALNPFTWSGRGFMGQLWCQPGLASAAFDLFAWLAVVLAAAVLARQVATLDL
jgi:hypothetical protein